MPPPEKPTRPPTAPDRRAAVASERFELLEHLQAALEPLMVALGLVFLGLLVVEFSGWGWAERYEVGLNRAETVIYWIFVADFLLRFTVAPAKGPFLRANVLTAASLLVPALRPLRVLRAARALRSIHLLRLLGGANRGMRALRRITRGRQFAYLATLSLLVTLLGAGGALFLDRGAAGTPLTSFGEALWWAATLVTTINSGADPVSAEARLVAVLMRLYAVSVFGLVTASIASYFIGRAAGQTDADPAPSAAPAVDGALVEQVAALRREVALLRRELGIPGGIAAPSDAAAQPSSQGDG